MLPWTYLIFGLLGGVLVGWLLSYWFTASRQNQVALRLEDELRGQLDQKETEIKTLRKELESQQSARSISEARLESVSKAQEDQSRLHDQTFKRLREEHSRALQDLKDSFKALSANALKETHPAFLQLAKESFATFQETAKGDLSKRQEAVAGLIKPLEEQLKVYRQQLTESEQDRSKTFGQIKNHLEILTNHSQSLSQETLQLRRILSSNQARGRWGEETLRRVVEAAGMSSHCDFDEQVQSGESKPDMIVRLPGDRVIVVDAKVPDLGFVDQINEADPAKRSEVLSNHVAKLKLTIRELAGRDYPGHFPNALDYVVLFLPVESLFSVALEADQDLIVWAAERKILIATPTSLIALLRSVSVSWKQHAQTENAQAIASAAEELYKRIAVFVEHLEKIRTGLDTASGAYNKAVGSYERSIRPSGERMLKLSRHTETEMKDLTSSTQGTERCSAEGINMMNTWDQRFGGIERLYGKRGSQKIRDAHVCIIGIGGVGSWTAESLARTGIGKLTLVDMDEVCVTNVNRQVHALDGEVGQLKVESMARRISLISPDCIVQPQSVFFTQTTSNAIFDERYDVVVDAIDRLNAKCLLLNMAKQAGLPIVSTGAAGGRMDPFQIVTADLSQVHHDRLLQKVRKQLRTEYAFPRGKTFGIPCVFSPEPARDPRDLEDDCEADLKSDRPGHLGCAGGYGSVTHVTGGFGFSAAGLVVKLLLSS